MNIVSTNVTSTMLTNSDDKKVRYKIDCYSRHTILLVIILLFIIFATNLRLKQEGIDTRII